MKRKSFVNLTLALTLGVTTLGGSVAYATINKASQQQTQEQQAKSEYDTIVENVKVMQEKLGSGDVSIEEQKQMTSYLLENLPSLIEAHSPKIGDTVDEVGVWLELMEANEQMEDFQLYLDTVDLTKYTPMSSEELDSLIGE